MGHLSFDHKGRATKGTPDAWLPVAAQIAEYAREFAKRGDIVANVGPGVGGLYATACWTPIVADLDVNTESCLPGYTPDRVDFADAVFQLGALPFVGAVTHEAAHARWTCWVPGDLLTRRAEGYEQWTQATIEIIIALEESRIETLAVRADPAKRAALAQCALSIVLKDFKVNTTLFGASVSLALTVGRYALLSPEEVARFRALVAPHLPLGLMGRLEALIREYHALTAHEAKDGKPSDRYYGKMFDIASRWLIAIRETAAAVAEAAAAPEPAVDDDADDASDDSYMPPMASPSSPDAPGKPGEGAGEGEGEGEGEGSGAPSGTADAGESRGEDAGVSAPGQDAPESDETDESEGSATDAGEGGSEPSEDADVDAPAEDAEADIDVDSDVDETDADSGSDAGQEPADEDNEADTDLDDEGEAESFADDLNGDDEGDPESGTGRYDDREIGSDGYDDESTDDDDDEAGNLSDEAEAEAPRDVRQPQPDLRSGIPGEDEETGMTVIVISLDGSDDESEGAAEGESGSLADEIRGVAGEAAMDREGDALDERAEKVAERKVEDRAADHGRRDEAAIVLKRRHGEGTHGYSEYKGSRMTAGRAPEAGERIAANRLAATLERITFHDRAVKKVDRVLPGGKLRPRAAVARAADRDRGGRAEVPIWRAKERRHTAETPVTVGIMNDVSGSMGSNSVPAAVLTYVVSQAVATIEGKCATAVFGSRGYLVNRAYERTTEVVPWAAMDGTEAFREGALLLDAELNLLDGEGARILVIFTDSQLVSGLDAEYARTFMRLCKQKNVAVVWCSYHETPSSNFGHGAVLNLSGTAADIANTLGDAILKEVSKVEASRGA